MDIFPVSRFLFAKLSSDFRTSEINALIQSILPFNPRVKIASPHYYLYYVKSEGLFFGKKIVGFPAELPKELFYRDFGGEKIKSIQEVKLNLAELNSFSFVELVNELSVEFDQKIEKMIIVIDIESGREGYSVDIFVE